MDSRCLKITSNHIPVNTAGSTTIVCQKAHQANVTSVVLKDFNSLI